MEQKPELNNQQTEIEDQPQESDNQNTENSNFWEKEISRRQFLKAGGAIVGTAGIVIAAKKTADIISSLDEGTQQPESLPSPEVLKSSPEFGFNTHVHAYLNGEADNMTFDGFKGDVDRLVEANQDWIRFNLINTGSINQNEDGSLNFTEGIEVFDEAIKYAKERGLKIALVTNAPESLASLPTNEYADHAAAFYTQLALRYGDKIDNWQIFNEADTHHFRDYHTLDNLDQAYLEELSEVVKASSEAIKSVLPDTKITMNASLWAPDKNIIRDRTSRFFDAVSDHLDFISLDPYPDVYDPNSGSIIPEDIEFFSKRYNKDIAIAEFGVSAHDIPDAQKRASILNLWISAIKSGNVQPIYTLIYEMRDEKANQDPREAKFGNEDTWDQIAPQMQPPQEESSVTRPTA